MKRILSIVVCLLLLTGCSREDIGMQRAMNLRNALLQRAVTFDAAITADYGSYRCSFVLACKADSKGLVEFTVKEPEAIAGITGTISPTGGKLTFDGLSLGFELLADGEVSPVSAPWILIKTLRSGYLTSSGSDGQLLRISIDDSYKEDALHLDIWLTNEDVPVRGEIYWQGRRILSVAVSNFTFV